ncbi:MAG: hypothetical protein CMG00_09315 [Candidatus Marinimicrobia bacterium]|nr:hypothetical protein [Candidatus Neomarinimicrobiota bacterium]|tara:strand:- start:7872 stop:8870 length:999 start_codon:yes stop_codon:yes gene_type:complete
MIELVKYKDNMINEWDYFIDQSKNGTIFHYRDFLSYHIDREFIDSSVIFKKRGETIAVFPSAIKNELNKKILFSHPGASFGGVVMKKTISLGDILEILNSIENYALEKGAEELTIIPTPLIYNKNNDESLLYALKWRNYLEKEQYYSSIIPINNNLEKQCQLICKNNGRSFDYYDKIIQNNNLKICWSNKFEDFYPILEKDKQKYSSKPTHSINELVKLKKLFPKKIKLLSVYKGTQTIGGSVIFITNSKTAVIFYNSINYDYADLQIATIQIIELIKWAHLDNIKYLDFGVSHKAETATPLAPKMSLIKFKENFNSFGTMRFVYNKKLDVK